MLDPDLSLIVLSESNSSGAPREDGMDMEKVLKTAPWLQPEGFLKAIEAGLCVRCVLRFGGVQQHDVYAYAETTLREALYAFLQDAGLQVNETMEKTVCTCCLDILSAQFHDAMIEEVRRVTDGLNYDVDTFTLNIKLPSAVLLREYSLREHFGQIIPGYRSNILSVDLKDVLKSLVTDRVAKVIDVATCAAKSEFAVLLEIKHDESAEEAQQIPAIKEQLDTRKKRHRGPPPVLDGFGAVTRALAALTTMPSTVKCPPPALQSQPTCGVVLERDPVYIQGRYLKYKRGLSQTPWVLDGVRMGDSSVEECIGEVGLPFFKGSGYKFHTAGREDVDVRMLGNGRPFILEILDAKKSKLTPAEYEQLQAAVNTTHQGAVEIREVKASTKEYFGKLQAGADSKRKTYCCVVWSEKELTPDLVAKLDAIHDLTIQQQTPIRVLHRRTLMTRPKVIHATKCEVLNKHYMLLRLTTSAGTYVKEFVHGDRGRTVPNVSTILECEADILQLDVESLIDAE
ncbi:hypothetical protein Poli38472_002885 [Pythium oligandrum]|uniref:tRNA pseudouridine(55) synthase n=1 Tax=Pythium oligandrum TaxID=41045 RepID=A0A8K1C5Y9_PYTOL|nr:hypothetical protein Poli38472_002885 [Pythium oligandrum]|eukprot:TMW56960.1 hypothetical protein Poli38472_002885 [Pythium oligandrum]